MSPPQAQLLQLQRSAGNAAVTRMLDGPFPGREHSSTAYGRAFNFKGKTDASYSHSWDHQNDVVKGNKVTGDLVEEYSVSTQITLPPVPDGLSECEMPIVEDAINNKLNAHELDHVAAFETYNGSVTKPFSLSGTADQVTAALEARHQANEKKRRAAAAKRSKALDPFMIKVNTSSCDE
ncbi:MAG: hypothetical protein QOF60_319 [Actinomycetota bacterium]|jgi:hypothetical protein|nr:hypothetical protein [Actinomycetota bacterium]